MVLEKAYSTVLAELYFCFFDTIEYALGKTFFL